MIRAIRPFGLLLAALAAFGTASDAATIVKVGRYRINVDQIHYTVDDGGALVVVFADESRPQLRLEGDEARAFRRWLDVHGEAAPGVKAARAIDFDPGQDLVRPIRMSDPMRTPQGPNPRALTPRR